MMHKAHWISMERFCPIVGDAEQLTDLHSYALVFCNDIGLDYHIASAEIFLSMRTPLSLKIVSVRLLCLYACSWRLDASFIQWRGNHQVSKSLTMLHSIQLEIFYSVVQKDVFTHVKSNFRSRITLLNIFLFFYRSLR